MVSFATLGLAHDLNQSIGLIAGYTELSLHELEKTDSSLADVRHQLEVARRAALDSCEMLERFLQSATCARTESAQPVDLGELLTDAVELTAVRWRDTSLAGGRPIDVRVEAVDDCVVWGSQSALRHVFMNLIFNAIEALPNGGSISLQAWRGADFVEVEVRDTGRGMSAEVQTRLFEPFFTTRGARGFGLGLAQIWETVEDHGGSIDVESAVGQGTRFRLTFPIAASLNYSPRAANSTVRAG